jgi:hypothetical protein
MRTESPPTLGQRAEEAFLAILPRNARVRREMSSADAVVDFVVNDQPIEVKWIGDGRLSDVRRVIAIAARNPDVVVGRRLSPGAKEMLAAEGIGWVDETGAAEIAVGSLVVARTGTAQVRHRDEPKWTSSVLAVAEALLCDVRATVAATEEATGLSTGSCTTALRTLTDLGLLEANAARGKDSARRIGDRDALLDAYTRAVEAQPEPLSLQLGVTWQDPVVGVIKVGKRWDEASIPWAATGAIAATVTAPLLTSVSTADVYIDAHAIVGLEAVARQANLQPIPGGRLTVRPFPTATSRRLAERADGLRVAPWPRVYVDLLKIGVRGEEAAEHLRAERRGR